MQRTASGLRAVAGARLADLGRRAPEWGAWLRMLGEVERALADAKSEGGRTVDVSPAATEPAPAAPLLHGRTVLLEAGRATRLLRRLLALASADPADGAAATLAGYRPGAEEGLRLLSAAVRRDPAAIAGLAAGSSADPAALSAVAELAAVPPLTAAAQRLRGPATTPWPYGYCPACGAWPVLAELRGLERARVLRCGRCAADWPWEWLRCVFCGERHHERLGLLAGEETRDSRRAETCVSCRGYLKSIATLQPPSGFELLVLDLETVELDLAALDRGFARPEGNGYPLDARFLARGRSLRRLFTDG